MPQYTPFINDPQWEVLEPQLPKATAHPKGGRPAVNNRDVLGCLRRHLMGSAHRGAVEGSAGAIPQPDHLLAAAAAMGGTGGLDVWRKFLSLLEEKHLLDWQEAFIDGSFAPATKGAPASGPPKRAKAQSGCWWSTAKVFLWEATCLGLAGGSKAGGSGVVEHPRPPEGSRTTAPTAAAPDR